MKDSSRLAGEMLRRCVDAPPSEVSHAAARRQLVDRLSGQRPTAARRRMVFALAAALAVVSVVIGAVYVRQPQGTPMTYTVAAGSVDADPGTYFAPIGTEPVLLRFAEGSRIQLEPASRARIARTTAHGASLLLETGKAHLDIEPRPGADWQVIAGPYSVSVRGTAFSVSWDASTGTFEVKMDRGVVLVRGPGIDEGVELSGTQHFAIRDPNRGPLTDASAVAPATAAPSATVAALPSEPGEPPVVGTAPRADGGKSDLPRRGDLPAEPARDTWPQLAAQGQYRRIVDAAQERGVDSVIQGAGLEDLWAFADAARVTGQGSLARKALLAVRSRFPGTKRAASAAFLLGRMSDDGGGSAGALQWYERYLAEAPGGAFAPEAQGRRMVALKQSGNLEAGRRAAEAYLKQYPSGPYAAVARDMLAP